MKTVDVLGTNYLVMSQNKTQNPKLRDADGLCELYTKQIILDNSWDERTDEHNFDNMESYYHKVLRHEALHALFYEAGLSKYTNDEDLIDAIAILYPKMRDLLDSMDLMYIDDI